MYLSQDIPFPFPAKIHSLSCILILQPFFFFSHSYRLFHSLACLAVAKKVRPCQVHKRSPFVHHPPGSIQPIQHHPIVFRSQPSGRQKEAAGNIHPPSLFLQPSPIRHRKRPAMANSQARNLFPLSPGQTACPFFTPPIPLQSSPSLILQKTTTDQKTPDPGTYCSGSLYFYLL